MTLLTLFNESTPASFTGFPADVKVWLAEPDQELGDLVRAQAVVTSLVDFERTLVDPYTVTAKVKPPTGDPMTVAVVHDGLGAYHADFVADSPGVWRFRFMAEGGHVGASVDGMFHVLPSAF